MTNADKANNSSPIAHAAILSILQKSIARRVSLLHAFAGCLWSNYSFITELPQNDSAAQFRSASRPDLAEKEELESQVLSGFLPAQLGEEVIEERLREAYSKLNATTGNPGALVGKLMKAFYETTERASVQADTVSKKARQIIQAAAKS